MQGQVCVVIFLLLQCASHVLSEICPHPEDLYPCVCIYAPTVNNDIDVICKNVYFKSVQNAVKSLKDKTVRNVRLEKVNIGWLPSLFFFGLKIENLYFNDCRLRGIADAAAKPAFVGLEKSLQTLSINNSIKGKGLTAVRLAHLEILKELDLSYNNIPELDNTWFKDGPVTLEKITIYSSGTRVLGDRAFEKLINLKYLMISSAPFKTYHRSMLPNPAALLESLYFENANLYSLPVDAFKDMNNLIHISLERNSITRLPSDTWEDRWDKYETVNLMGNPLECDSHIDWTFAGATPKAKPVNLEGICLSPESRKNIPLKYVIDLKIPTESDPEPEPEPETKKPEPETEKPVTETEKPEPD